MPRPPKRCPGEAEARDLPSEVPCGMWHDQSRDMNEIPWYPYFNDVPWRCSTVFLPKEILEHHWFSGECAGPKVIITSEAWNASNVWHMFWYQTYRKTWQFSAVHLIPANFFYQLWGYSRQYSQTFGRNSSTGQVLQRQPAAPVSEGRMNSNAGRCRDALLMLG